MILLAERPAAACSAPAPPRLREDDLWQIWHGQRFPAEALITTASEQLAVVFRGRPGSGAGPDFRDALIALPDGRVLQGDVELHVRSTDCLRHGHPDDPAYGHVILHLVYQDDLAGPSGIGPPSMRTVALAPWLDRRAGELEGWLSRPPLWQEPCVTAVERLGPTRVAAILRRTGFRRFEEHVAAAAREVDAHGPTGALLRLLFDGLGFSQNRVPFRVLGGAAATLGPDEPLLEAQLFALAGFLQAPSDGYTRELVFAARGLQPLGLEWRLWGIRPDNHPHRRLAAGARLASRLLREGPAALVAAAEAGRAALIAALAVPAGGYWREHSLLGRAGPGAALVGAARASELAVNAVLPWLAACGEHQGRPDFSVLAHTLYATFPPASDYGLVRPVERWLRHEGRRVVEGAAGQQGLLYLHRSYCTRGRCLECPLGGGRSP